MTIQIAASRLTGILERCGFAADTAEALVLVLRRTAAVVWASEATLHHLGAPDAVAAEDILFRKGAAGPALAGRLARISTGGAYRLERLSLPHHATPLVLACHPIDDGDASLALLHVRNAVPVLARPSGPAPASLPSASVAVPAAPCPERISTRVLWETDAAGRFTRIGPEMRLMGAQAPRLGDDLPGLLRDTAPELADRLAAAAAHQDTVGLTPVEWRRQDSAADPIALELGCSAKRGGSPGLRGFFVLRGRFDAEEPTEAAVPAIEAESPSAAGAAPASGTEPDGRTDDDVLAEVSASGTIADLDPPVDADPHVPDRLEPEPFPLLAGGGNVVHFPLMRLGHVPANFMSTLQSAPRSEPVPPDGIGLPEPRWSEAPPVPAVRDEAFENLSADERDAFEHIRKVLGTRPFPQAERVVAPVAALPAGLPQLLDQVPLALRLETKGTAYANAALRDRIGTGTAEAEPGRPGEAPLADAPATFDLAGAPATLTIVPPFPASLDRPGQRAATAEGLDVVTDGHLRLDEDGSISACSPKAARLLGLDAPAVLGRSFATVLFEGQAPGWHALAAAATGPEAQPQGPSPLRLRNAAGQPVAVTVRLGRSDGTLLCAFTLDRPTALPANDSAEAARREAERTSALKSEFLAKVSHEIRTPLNAILGFAEVIRDERLGPVGNARYLDYMRDIHASGTHVMSLVNDLLDLSRIEAGRMDLNLEAVDANAIVQSCVNTLQTVAHSERIVVRLSLTPRLPATLADERSLRQIVLNLLSNAIKFNEPGGQVIVSTALAGVDAVAIRIRDTGIGMSEDEIEAAMEPFRQLSTVNRTGSGLGLPLTKALVEANCATMTIKSTRQEGTLVEIRFPLVEADPVSLPAE